MEAALKNRDLQKLMEEYRDYDKSAFYLPRQYLPQPHGGICDEGLSGKGEAFRAV